MGPIKEFEREKASALALNDQAWAAAEAILPQLEEIAKTGIVINNQKHLELAQFAAWIVSGQVHFNAGCRE